MATEIVGGAALAPPTAIGGGRLARLRQLAPFLPAAVILVGLFFVPLALMLVYSFFSTNENLDMLPIWTLENYENFFKNPTYVRTLLKTMLIGAAVTVVSLMVAFVVAYFLARYVSRRWARIALLIIIVPFWTSYLLRVYSWQAILGEKGALNQVLVGRASCASRRCCSSTTTSARSSCSSTCTSRSPRWSCTPPWSGSTSRSSRRPRISAPARSRRSATCSCPRSDPASSRPASSSSSRSWVSS